MKLPHQLLENPLFQLGSAEELILTAGDYFVDEQKYEINRLIEIGLPPIIDDVSLAMMIGVNPGIIWSFANNSARHYDTFPIPKGDGQRLITAPRVALKVIQKWLSVHLAQKYTSPEHVFGFVTGLSHIDAAKVHLNADWVISIDIRDFFPSLKKNAVTYALKSLGYNSQSAKLISSLSTLNGSLPQGSPMSPVLSNICLRGVDKRLVALANRSGSRLSRYADDITLSGIGEVPEGILEKLKAIIDKAKFEVADEKTEVMITPNRRKVHGLLVGGDSIRTTKGYRRKVRALRHLLSVNKILDSELYKVLGIISYQELVDRES